jgi:hypothetical protein
MSLHLYACAECTELIVCEATRNVAGSTYRMSLINFVYWTQDRYIITKFSCANKVITI